MSKYLSVFFISICLSLGCKANPKKTFEGVPSKDTMKALEDTIKVEYNWIPFHRPQVVLEFYNSYYTDTNMVNKMNHPFKTVRLNILFHTKSNSSIYIITPENRDELKTMYAFSEKDSLVFNARFSSVKYYGEYYIVAFPQPYDWYDFESPEDDYGNFIYTPIAFHLDTLKYQLTRMNYNPAMNIPRRIHKPKDMRVMIYSDNKYAFQFARDFAFSKGRNEFVFGKRKYEEN